MVSDQHFEMCLPVLEDNSLEEEDKTDKLEELFREKTNLRGSSLDSAVLDVLWRFRDGTSVSASPPPIRHNVLRRPSPASWRHATPPLSGSPRLGVSPLAPPGFMPAPFQRAKSSTASPFSSPRASPRLAFATPAIPHSPNLNAYEFANDFTPATEILGDSHSENVEWLVNDDAVSVASSVGTPSALNAAVPEFVSSMSGSNNAHQSDMSPYDMLRSILGPTRTDEEIEAALSSHGYDLSATIASIMEGQTQDAAVSPISIEGSKNVLVGKSIASPEVRPATPNGQQKSGVICKFFMSTGQCLRADCRFSHDLSNHLCKYWMMGNCLAGDTCIFSHDPSKFMKQLSLDGSGTPPVNGQIQVSDANAFPALQSASPTPSKNGSLAGSYTGSYFTSPSALRSSHGTDSPRSRSRPASRHKTKDFAAAAPALDDNEAFPSLGSGEVKQSKKHQGQRGPGQVTKETLAPSSLADIVKMSPSPTPSSIGLDAKRTGRNGAVRNGENSLAAQAITSPKHIPWLETGERANKAYLKARQEAIKHGGLRNKFLQSAAQAWNRNDARAAKALSLRGQSENDLMRKAHREAAQELYEDRNKSLATSSEVYVDLHGLHPEEAVEYLEKVLLENGKESRPIYAITGTGHHSKNGKDKVGKAIRNFLNEWSYAYREFSVPGDRNNMGGILGIDARSWDRSLGKNGNRTHDDDADSRDDGGVDIISQGVEIGDGKVRLLVRDPPKGPSGRR